MGAFNPHDILAKTTYTKCLQQRNASRSLRSIDVGRSSQGKRAHGKIQGPPSTRQNRSTEELEGSNTRVTTLSHRPKPSHISESQVCDRIAQFTESGYRDFWWRL